jgi:hypothetical protein
MKCLPAVLEYKTDSPDGQIRWRRRVNAAHVPRVYMAPARLCPGERHYLTIESRLHHAEVSRNPQMIAEIKPIFERAATECAEILWRSEFRRQPTGFQSGSY